jgi:hypothetical protein
MSELLYKRRWWERTRDVVILVYDKDKYIYYQNNVTVTAIQHDSATDGHIR